MKKFYFEYCEYAQMDVLDGVVVFEESEEQAVTYFKEILASEDFQQKVPKVDFEDFGEPEEMSVKNPYAFLPHRAGRKTPFLPDD